MTTERVDRVLKMVPAWAKMYVQLTEELMRQGVTEERAREEARYAANFALLWEDEPETPEF